MTSLPPTTNCCTLLRAASPTPSRLSAFPAPSTTYQHVHSHDPQSPSTPLLRKTALRTLPSAGSWHYSIARGLVPILPAQTIKSPCRNPSPLLHMTSTLLATLLPASCPAPCLTCPTSTTPADEHHSTHRLHHRPPIPHYHPP
ncbi:hypothetical protein PTTG_28729 [Puccinia triticina 1-1 BBBD Race 1]|uniref:Uncharacterized protein n=1 Tax=Puccinia triticina (isolate 1-1 / race 1 (BBBD)) TaxID=630390 RepID=A0A180GAG4_PUCT1|nr:hypothetical protein PTTG_28729 [Puccinia triticina 1-1 BBBD Race 1]